MVISTVLRLMRGAMEASLKSGKFAINASGKFVRVGARAVKHNNMLPDEKRVVKKAEKSKDKADKVANRASETVIKATGRLISEGFIFLIGIIEDISVLLVVVILILALMLLVVVVSVFGTFTSVMAMDTTSTSVSVSKELSHNGGKKKAVVITDPYTYDWWGNRDANRLKLADQWDRDIYDLVACNFELYKHTKNNDYYWDPMIGIGTTLMESGLPHSGMFNYIDGNIDNDKEKEKAQSNMATYLFKAHWCAGSFSPADAYGDGPTGNSFAYVKDISYDFGPFKASNISSSEYELLRNSIAACQGHSSCETISSHSTLSDNELYAIYNIAGCIYWDYKEITIGLKEYNGTENKIVECMQAYGLCSDKNNLSSEENKIKQEILYSTYYNKHHGSDSEATGRVVEYLTCMLAYSDNHSFKDWGIEAHDGVFDSRSDFNDFRSTSSGLYAYYTGIDGANYKSKVLRGGKVETFDSAVLSKLVSFAKERGRESQWSDLVNNVTTNAYYYNANMSACVTCVICGHTIVNYLVDKLGIVFDADDGYGGEAFSKADTVTQANLKDVMLKYYVKGGDTSYDISDDFLSDVEAYKKKNPKITFDKKYTKSTNPWFNGEWCAATVKALLSEAKLGDTEISIKEALRKHGTYPADHNCADLGIGGWGRMATGTYNVKSCEGYSNLIRVHYTHKSAIQYANNGGIGNYPTGAESPQCVNYVSDGVISVVKESLYEPKSGDIIIYSYNGYGWAHIGLCYDYDKSSGTIITVEGNTGTSSGIYGYTSHSFNYKEDTELAWIVEIDYVGLEKLEGISSVKDEPDESGVFKVDSFIKDKVKTGLTSISSNTKKLIDVSVDGTDCTVTTYEKKANDRWDVGEIAAVSGYVGKNGVASGSANATEGSKKTPYGTYYCRTGFGNGTKDSIGVKMSTWYDISSGIHTWSGSGTSTGFDGGDGIEINKYYNGAVSGGTGAETISEYKDTSYKYSMFIEYNSGSGAKAGQGSAFFLHVGSQPTAGCVAVSESDMLKIVKWADDNTVICIHNSNEVIGRQSLKSN